MQMPDLPEGLTEDQIQKNKAEFEQIVQTYIKRNGIDRLMAWLQTNTDFFRAPASTRFHEAYAGGLCEHSLTVFHKLEELNAFAKQEYAMSEESVAICALFHDLCKTNFYKEGRRNVKNEATGKWESVPFYQVEDQFPYGHGEKSVYLIEHFVRLKTEEAVAIRWHMGGFDDAVRGGSYAAGDAFDRYPSSLNLHIADMQATYQKY